jgi:hypothetical protein
LNCLNQTGFGNYHLPLSKVNAGVVVPMPTLPEASIKTRVRLLVVDFRGAAFVILDLELVVALLLAKFRVLCAFTVCKPDNATTAKVIIVNVGFTFIVEDLDCLKFFKN